MKDKMLKCCRDCTERYDEYCAYYEENIEDIDVRECVFYEGE